MLIPRKSNVVVDGPPLELSRMAEEMINLVDSDSKAVQDADIEVNPVISEVASWYEKLRNAMEYKEDEMIFHSAIERILKRRVMIDGAGNAADALVRELAWARYFPDNAVPHKIIVSTQTRIDLYLELEEKVLALHKNLPKTVVQEWIMNLLSTELEKSLRPNVLRETFSNFIFHIFREKIEITDCDEETKNIQVYLGIKKAFAKEDTPMLRYELFKQYFGPLSRENLDVVARGFNKYYSEAQRHLNSPYKDKIYAYIRKYMPSFLILQELVFLNRGKMGALTQNSTQLTSEIIKLCNSRYKNISQKITRAIVRSVIFIFFTKAIFGLTFETTFENMLYGHINWLTIGVNILFPPVLMIMSGMFLQTPGQDNSVKIAENIRQILTETNNPPFIKMLSISRKSDNIGIPLLVVYSLLWLLTLLISVTGIAYVLRLLNFNPVSQLVFLFFLTVVSFLSYRISQKAKIYKVTADREGLTSFLFDFFFLPFIQLGKNLALGFSRINIVLFVFDYLIETPFKEMFRFMEQWLTFLRRQRELLD